MHSFSGHGLLLGKGLPVVINAMQACRVLEPQLCFGVCDRTLHMCQGSDPGLLGITNTHQ